MENAFERNIYTQSLQVVERFAKYILKDVDNKNEIKMLNELSSYIIRFSNALDYNEAKNKIFDDFIARVDSSKKELNCDTVLEEFDKEINSIKDQLLNVKESEKFSNILQLIAKQNLMKGDEEDDNDEVVTLSQNIANIDPITKLPIVDPVKNKNCGHVYEKNSIMQLIAKNSKTKCPIAGCVASGFVQAKDLVSDYALKRILSEKLIENSQKKIKVSK